MSVINAYLRQSDKTRNAVADADRVYQQMENYIRDGSIPPEEGWSVLRTMMEVMLRFKQESSSSSLRPQDEELAKDIFCRICQRGRLTNQMLRVFKQLVNQQTYMDVLKVETTRAKITVRDLPKEWSCNLCRNVDE